QPGAAAARPGRPPGESQASRGARHSDRQTGPDRGQAGNRARGPGAGRRTGRTPVTVAGAFARPFSPLGRWIMRRLWWVEHAFERSRASEKAVDDTRLRIFFVLALFAAGFV